MAPDALSHVLRQLQNLFPTQNHPEVLVGLEVSDDAAVYQINADLALVLTLDFFTPVVDDPYDYGAIAAANALSDIYAMGGEVALALNICAFPTDLPPEITAEILRGGAEKVKEAGGVLAGGHTIDDKEPKYGLAVLGLIHPQKIWTKSRARPGDVLILTKPLGVGMLTTALKADLARPDQINQAVASMKLLNRQAAQLIQKIGVNAATDITGFGLLGHAFEMAEKSQVGLQLHFNQLPFLDGAQGFASDWLFPGGACRNQKFFTDQVQFHRAISEEMQLLLFTPETSGGLLVSVPAEKIDWLSAEFKKANQPCWIIGEVVTGAGIQVQP